MMHTLSKIKLNKNKKDNATWQLNNKVFEKNHRPGTNLICKKGKQKVEVEGGITMKKNLVPASAFLRSKPVVKFWFYWPTFFLSKFINWNKYVKKDYLIAEMLVETRQNFPRIPNSTSLGPNRCRNSDTGTYIVLPFT